MFGFFSRVPSPQASQKSAMNCSCAKPISSLLNYDAELLFSYSPISSWHRTASRIRRKRLSGNADEGNRAAHAAIHAVENPIDVTGLIGCQENRHCGDIIRLAKPRRIQHVHKVRVHLRSRPSDFRWRLNGARQYRVAADALLAESRGEGLNIPVERGFRRAIAVSSDVPSERAAR